jgi:REP element-mobilizing transposase RayT
LARWRTNAGETCHPIFPGFLLDRFVVMPNHVHGIIVVVGATHASPLPVGTTAHGPRSGSLAAIVGSFKSATTRRVNRVRGTPRAPFWQRGYYEHVLRDEGDLEKIRTYVAQNPLSWELDENCLDRLLARDGDRAITLRD